MGSKGSRPASSANKEERDPLSKRLFGNFKVDLNIFEEREKAKLKIARLKRTDNGRLTTE